MTDTQATIALLAILNDRVGVTGEQGAWDFLGELLGIDGDEARTSVDEFEYREIRYTYRIREDRPGFMRRCWAVEARS